MSAPSFRRTTALLCLLAGASLLSGCVSRDISDLEQYSQSILARPGGRIDPLPEVKPYERYVYKAADDRMRDPFVSFLQTAIGEGPGTGKTQRMTEEQKRLAREVFERNKEELEGYELDSLRMVGTLENEASLWGIILDTAGVVHRVTVGNYMGRNNGKIISIQEDEIGLREIITGPDGDLIERAAELALAED